MTDYVVVAFWIILGLFLVIKVNAFFNRSNKLGIDGKLVWTDRGKNTKPFFNNYFRVLGKPDLMYKVRSGILAVEYKSRRGRIYTSDIMQARAAALAARGSGYQVIRVLLRTRNQELYIDLPKKDSALFKLIQTNVAVARDAKSGRSVNPKPTGQKCRGCAYTNSCSHS